MAKVKKKKEYATETVLPANSEIFINCSFIDKGKERIWQILGRLLKLLPRRKHFIGFPGVSVVKKKKKKKKICLPMQEIQETWVPSLGWEDPLCQPTSVFLLGIFHGQRSQAGYNPRGCKEVDKNEHTHTHTQNLLTKVSYVETFLVVQWLRICLPEDACSIPGGRTKIPHAARQLSPCAPTIEPAC